MAKVGESKYKYWVVVMYLENMILGWQELIGDLLQLPFAYCIHDADRDSNGDIRKAHAHIMIAFSNTTTYKNACSVLARLNADGKQAFNKIEPVINVRHMYDYLIHDTETCRKQKKHLYASSDRITGNNFDIGSYEQLSTAEKNAMRKELCSVILNNGFCNFATFYECVVTNYDDQYLELVATYSGLFERLTKGNYQRMQLEKAPRRKEDERAVEDEDED